MSPRMRPAALRVIGAFAAGIVTLTGMGASAAALTPPPPLPYEDGHGLEVVSAERSGRQVDLVLRSTALQHDMPVIVLLPRRYRERPAKPYPTMLLFHGTGGRASDWLTMGDAASTLRDRRLLTVIPDVGFDGNGGGWFLDWVHQDTALGPSRWETYLIDELVPWVDDNLPTRGDRGGRAAVGLSQGGYGAMSLASRHPDMFTMAASFSGAPAIDRDPDAAIATTAVVGAIMVSQNGVRPDAAYGARPQHDAVWASHDPARQIPNLRATRLWLTTGDGTPGGPEDPDPLLNPDRTIAGGGIESIVHRSSTAFHGYLLAAGKKHHWDDYGPGTHSWPYWARELRTVAGPLMRRFAADVDRPARVTFRAWESTWRQWGYRVSVRREARLAPVTLRGADADGFRLVGDGVARVRTPRDYRPRGRYRIRIGGRDGRTVRATADQAGRLRVRLDLAGGEHRVRIRPRRG